MTTEEMKMQKARSLRIRKPIVKNLNYDFILSDLYDIQEECEEVHWYTDSDDGEDSLINALCGDEEEAFEFKMAFSDLCAECDQMQQDIRESWVPDCFDLLFVTVSQNEDFIYGWDGYESDYMPIGTSDSFIRDEAYKKLSRMKKEEIIEAVRQCLRVYQSYLGLRNRHDNLKSALDILKNQNTGYLQAVKEIQKLYENVTEPFHPYSYDRAFDRLLDALPREAWLI